jgi:hypothetical protein
MDLTRAAAVGTIIQTVMDFVDFGAMMIWGFIGRRLTLRGLITTAPPTPDSSLGAGEEELAVLPTATDPAAPSPPPPLPLPTPPFQIDSEEYKVQVLRLIQLPHITSDTSF